MAAAGPGLVRVVHCHRRLSTCQSRTQTFLLEQLCVPQHDHRMRQDKPYAHVGAAGLGCWLGTCDSIATSLRILLIRQPRISCTVVPSALPGARAARAAMGPARLLLAGLLLACTWLACVQAERVYLRPPPSADIPLHDARLSRRRASANAPEQVHLTMAGLGVMAVSWVTHPEVRAQLHVWPPVSNLPHTCTAL